MRWLRPSAISEPVVRVHFVAEATVGRQGRAINRSHQMTVPRTAADVLDDHVTFELECIDRLYLNLYQPKLQHELGVVGFFKGHRGFQFVSSALMDPITKAFVAGIHRYVNDHDIPLVDFRPASAKTTSPSATLPATTALRGSCSLAARRRRPRRFGPRSAAMPRPARRFPGWSAAPPW